LGFGVFLTCVAVSWLFESVRFPERRFTMAAFALSFAALASTAAMLLRRRPAWTLPVLVVFVNAIGVGINVYHGRVDAPVAMCIWVLTALLASTGVILPWGRRNQALACLGALAFYPLHLTTGSNDPLTWAAGGTYLLAVTGLSVFGASLFAGYVRNDVRLTATLSEREARLQSYFDLSLIGTAIVGADGRCREVNEELCRMFGTTPAALLGAPWLVLIDADDRPVAGGLLAQALGSAPARMDLRCVGADETPLHASIAVRGLPGPDGRLDHALVLVHDITDRQRTVLEREESLTHTEDARRRAEDASRTKDVLLATVSHELRTPLTPIMAWADLLEDGGLGSEEQKQAITTIRRSARAQARLIDDLLDVSRIVAGKWQIDARPVDLVGVVHAALDVVRPMVGAKGVTLSTVVPEQAVWVNGDRERLQQVIWNLASNAIKFTPRGGLVHVTLEERSDVVRLTVRDTGEGIPGDFVPHAFEPFRQADGSSSRRYGGLGLGLAIVRALTEHHGGTVRATSDGTGTGATFIVELPSLSAAGAEAGERSATSLAAGTGMSGGPRVALRGVRVLVVDDDPDSNAVVRSLLVARGADVRTALSAAEALHVANGWRPDVVVSDIAMPGEDGIALLHQLRARRAALGPVPAIALTAYGSSADRRRLLDAGFQAHVAKPFDPVHLAAVVETAASAHPFAT
jgi:PAS domain S-box-containing protein